MRAKTRNRLWSAMLWAALAVVLLYIVATARAFDASVLLPVMDGVQWTPAALNPIVWYKAENNALDSSGNERNGTWTGTAAYNTGKVGSALDFTGATYLSTVASSVYLPSVNSPFTIAMWFRADSISSGALESRMVAIAASRGVASAILVTLGSNDVLSYYRNGSAVDFGVSIATATWYHVVISYDGTASSLYLNGAFVSSAANSLQAGSTSYVATIGASFLGAFNFDGRIDDFIFLRSPLTATEVKKLYDESVLKNGAAW